MQNAGFRPPRIFIALVLAAALLLASACGYGNLYGDLFLPVLVILLLPLPQFERWHGFRFSTNLPPAPPRALSHPRAPPV